MFRLLAFFLAIGSSAGLALWLASVSGYIELRIGDYEIRRPVAAFFAVLAVFALSWGFLFHVVLRTMAIPSALRRAGRESRSKKGHKALSDGLVAVASGDPDEARKQARLAAKYLESPSASLLLTAQSAQLNGRADAAEHYFEAMLEDPATRFLGLRGLIVKALKSNDTERALGLLLEAKSIKPKAPWVLDLEYQLRLERGELHDAEAVAKQLKRLAGSDQSENGLKVGFALLAQAVDEQQGGDSRKALDKAAEAAKAAPGFFAAHSMVAEMASAAGNKRRAAKALSKAWALSPSGDVANRFLAVRGGMDGDFAVKLAVARELLAVHPNHWASLAICVEALIDAGRGTEAQTMLAGWDNTEQEPDLVLLHTRLEKGEGKVENENEGRAQRFELSAGFFACTSCGTQQERWHSHCHHCGSTSSIRYQSRVAANAEHALKIAPVPLIES